MSHHKVAVFLSPRLDLQEIKDRLLTFDCKISKIFNDKLVDPVPDHALIQSWIAECIANEITKFIAIGGDGTLHLLANALELYAKKLPESSIIKLGCIGLGSSNDFVKDEHGTIRPRLDWNQAKQDHIAAFTTPHWIRYSFVGASIGVTAFANHLFNTQRGDQTHFVSLRILSCAIQAWLKFTPFRAELNLDTTALTLTLNNLGLSRQRAFAGSFRYDRTPEDSSMGVWLCLNMNRWQALLAMFDFARGRFSENKQRIYRSCKEVRISAQTEFELEMDGETTLCKQVFMQVERSRIYTCPKGMRP